jgi:hypothetical protein
MASQASAEPATEPADAPDAAGAVDESVCVPIEGMDAVEVRPNTYRDFVGRLEQAERRLEDAPASAEAEGAGDECVEAEPAATDVETYVAEDQSDTDTDTDADADAPKEHYPALRALVNKLRNAGQLGAKKAG